MIVYTVYNNLIMEQISKYSVNKAGTEIRVEYIKPMFEDLREAGCTFDQVKYSFSFNSSNSSKVEVVLNTYLGKSRPITPFQKKMIQDIIKFYNNDTDGIIYSKDTGGVFIIDVNGIYGTEKEINEDLLGIGYKIDKSIGRKHYVLRK